MATEYPVEESSLFVPSLEELAQLFSVKLKNDFTEVSAEVVDCPDLTKEPFMLACKGLGGCPRLVEVGGPPYLIPLVKKEKAYDLRSLSRAADGSSPRFFLGAGAGPWMSAGKNCEMMANVCIDGDNVDNKTHIAKLKDEGSDFCLELVPKSETRFALLANLFCCEGREGKVLKIRCKKRLSSENFITCLRIILEKEFQDRPVGLGGTFLIKSGKAKHHVMPDFSKEPLTSDDAVNAWLRFFNLSAPLVSLGTLISTDVKGLDLRLQHFHSFSDHGEGGHYHYDITPDEVEYEGYFNVAKKIFRIDRPIESHHMGRD